MFSGDAEGARGVTAARQGYFDDSSASLNLPHRSKPPSAEIFERGGDKLPRPSRLRDREIAEREQILSGEREKRDREIDKLVDAGCTPKQAAEILDAERGKHGKERKALERADHRRKSLESDMGVYKKPAKHSGSKSGRRRSGKRGTWICRECHLEFCEHRPVRSKGGRPAALHRSLKADARVSPSTKATLKSAGVGPSDALELAAIALKSGRPFSDVLAEFRSRKGMAAAPAA